MTTDISGVQLPHNLCADLRTSGPGSRRPFKPSTGLRASGYREGYSAALRWTQRELQEHLDEIGRARLAAVVARTEAAA